MVLGSNIRHELPLLRRRACKAQTWGAKIHVVNPVDFDFAFSVAGKQIVAPSKFVDALARRAAFGSAGAGRNNTVLIVGGIAENHPQAAAIRAAARDFAAGAKLCRIPQGANAVG